MIHRAATAVLAATLALSLPTETGAQKPPPPAPSIIDLSRACHPLVFEDCIAPREVAARLSGDPPLGCEQAAAPLMNACDGGSQVACCSLGMAYRLGSPGIARDFEKARAVLEAACTKGNGRVPACSHLAELHLEGFGVPKSPPRALALLDRACEGGEAHSCSFLCIIYLEGLGVPYDTQHFRVGERYCQRSCDLGRLSACWHLGIYLRGRRERPDPKRARALFTRACAAGHPTSCDELKKK